MEEEGKEEGKGSSLRSPHNYGWASYHYLIVALQIPASMLSWHGGGRAGTGEASSEGTWRGEFIESSNTAVQQHTCNTDSLLTGHDGLQQKSKKMLYY